MSASAIQNQRPVEGGFELLVDANLFSFQSAARKAASANLSFRRRDGIVAMMLF
jgi:hypothetical protein